MYAVEHMLHDPHRVTMRYVCSKNKSDNEPDKIVVDDGREFILDRAENTSCILDNYELCHFHNKDFLNFTTNLEQEATECVNDNDKLRVSRKIESLLPKKYVSCVRQLFEEGITPFPYKVAKGLDPDIYRNIEFDAWSDYRKTRRYTNNHLGYRGYFQEGLKCQVQLRGSSTSLNHCYIQRMEPNEGPCLVFVEELGEMREVKFSQLKISEKMPSWDVTCNNAKNKRASNQKNQKKSNQRHGPLVYHGKRNCNDNTKIGYNNNNHMYGKSRPYLLNQFIDFRNLHVPPCNIIAMPFKQTNANTNKGKFLIEKNNTIVNQNQSLKLDLGMGDGHQNQRHDDDEIDFPAQDFFANCASPSAFGFCDNPVKITIFYIYYIHTLE